MHTGVHKLAGQKRNKTEVASDRREIERLYLREKLTQEEIAERLKIDQSTVSRDLTAIRKQWEKERIKQRDEWTAEELARINMLEVTYWQAWAESVKDAEMERTKTRPEGGTEEIFERRGQSGNPAFLAGIQGCIDRKIKLLGLGADDKVGIALMLSPETQTMMKTLGVSMEQLMGAVERMLEKQATAKKTEA